MSIASAVLLPSLIALPAGGSHLLGLRFATLLLAGILLVARRRVPWLALLAASVATLLDYSSRLTMMAASYSVAVYQRRFRAAVLLLPVLLGILYSLDVPPDDRLDLDGLVAFTADVLLPALTGLAVRRQRSYGRAVRRGNRIVDGLIEGTADLAVERERARLARDLHDGIGHQLSIATLYAGVLEQRAAGDARLTAPARTVQDACAGAARQLSGMLGVLRGQGGTAERTDPRGSIAELVHSLRAAGVDVRFPEAREPAVLLPQETALTVFRIAQEALTNALKHAPGARVDVTLDEGAVPPEADGTGATLTLHVVNGPARHPRWGAPSSGLGLRGMRERARACGATLATGPLPEGGFAIRLDVPIPGPIRGLPGSESRGETVN
ncbi:sensor histidine kinase [Streptomyces kanamyceticus]|uniref:histidine kinase n=1 Tax=Streptomyces kanamyceticus TaxID=1967 RepID=A0A5J6GBG6_STRKN|nr:sensor histidine kinase [Streptomyces kanamyceticus]